MAFSKIVEPSVTDSAVTTAKLATDTGVATTHHKVPFMLMIRQEILQSVLLQME